MKFTSLCFFFFLVACGTDTESSNNGTILDLGSTSQSDMGLQKDGNDNADVEADVNVPIIIDTEIVLAESGILITGPNATLDGTTVTISKGGNFRISGTHSDAQIVVDSDDKEIVRLVLSDMTIESKTTAPFFVKSAEQTEIILEDGTSSTITDAENYIFADGEDEPNSAIFSKDDLVFKGTGTLSVVAKFNNGINSRDNLIFKSGNISLTSVDDGIIGRDSVRITGGTFSIEVGGDGIKSTEDTDLDLGFIEISGGEIDIISGDDGIQVHTSLLVSNATIKIISGGGSDNTVGQDESSKALKSASTITLESGTFDLNSADDAIHANDSIFIKGGELTIESGDDGVHADKNLQIDGGLIDVRKSYEGVESETITINGGEIRIVSSDDGLNAAGGNSNMFYMNDGYVYVDADGDGIDVNGSIEMTGGKIVVNGPDRTINGAFDYDRDFKITGGYFIATGLSRMSQTASSSSVQNAILVNFTSQNSSQMVHLQSASGAEIFSFVPTKNYESFAFSSAKVAVGTTYEVFFGGTSTGEEKDGLYEGGTYSGGSKSMEFEQTGVITTIGGRPR